MGPTSRPRTSQSPRVIATIACVTVDSLLLLAIISRKVEFAAAPIAIVRHTVAQLAGGDQCSVFRG